ncbi:putative paired amphipathic helix superfamily protein [Arabidopsis thaliana]
MKSCKRPRMKNQERDFYETPSDCSEEEIQRSCEFVKKVKDLIDLSLLSYIDLKTKVASILRNHDALLQEFHQLLLLDSPITEKDCNSAKSDVERTVELMKKVEGLGKGLHGAFLNKLVFGGDIVDLVEQLDVILRDHASLKEEFISFLIDSRLLKKPKRGFEAGAEEYKTRLETEEELSSSDEFLNGKYVSKSQYDPDQVKKKRLMQE